MASARTPIHTCSKSSPRACPTCQTRATCAPSARPRWSPSTYSSPGSRARTSPPPTGASASRRASAVACGQTSWRAFAYYDPKFGREVYCSPSRTASSPASSWRRRSRTDRAELCHSTWLTECDVAQSHLATRSSRRTAGSRAVTPAWLASVARLRYHSVRMAGAG